MIKRILLLLAASTSLASCSTYLPSWAGGEVEEKPKLEGERHIAIAVDSELVPDKNLINNKLVLPRVIANADWPQHSGVFTATTANIAGGKFDTKTSTKIGDGNSFSHSLVPRPVVADGMVFVMDSAGIISAHDAVNIEKRRWKSKEIADEDENEVVGGGLAISNGKLYATTGQGQVAAFNAKTGRKLWKKNFSVPMRGSPRVAGEQVIIMTINSQTYALSTKTGDILWDHRGINEASSVMNSVSPTIAGDDVLVPYSSGEIFALSLIDGKELWSESFMRNKYTQASSVFTGIGGDPVVDGDFAFITSNDGITAAINIPRGIRVWQQKAASLNTPWLAGKDLFLLTADNTLVDFVKYDGKIRWTTGLARYEDSKRKLNPISWRGPVLVNGNLLAVSSNGFLTKISAENGKILETKSIPSDIVTAPVVAGGRLYLVGQDAKLYSFK